MLEERTLECVAYEGRQANRRSRVVALTEVSHLANQQVRNLIERPRGRASDPSLFLPLRRNTGTGFIR